MTLTEKQMQDFEDHVYELYEAKKDEWGLLEPPDRDDRFVQFVRYMDKALGREWAEHWPEVAAAYPAYWKALVASCGQCAYWQVNSPYPKEVMYNTTGECRRRPRTHDGWPDTRADGWCGEFLPKDTGHKWRLPTQ